jgi:hypothetical protein
MAKLVAAASGEALAVVHQYIINQVQGEVILTGWQHVLAPFLKCPTQHIHKVAGVADKRFNASSVVSL